MSNSRCWWVVAAAVVSVSCMAQAQPSGSPSAQQPAAVIDRLESVVESRTPKQIGSGFKFTEGPLWDNKAGRLIFSDIGGNTVYAAVPGDEPFTPESASVVLKESKQANGNAFDREGQVVNAGSDRSIVRIADGKAVVIAGEFEGKRFNSPNDVVVKSDGSIYFTDPPFFAPKERDLGFSGMFRIGSDGTTTLLSKQFQWPNGLAFSADEKTLYINEHRKRQVWAFDVRPDGSLENGRMLIEMKAEQGVGGAADGLKVDAAGNIWTTGPGGVWVVSPTGEKIGVIEVRGASNLAFGGPDRKTLFITAGGNLYSLPTKVAGL
jgi:sugar lactone lactonase YvrE